MEFPIKILDNMIQVEEEMAGGFSLYNRGNQLKKSLINPSRVKEYLTKFGDKPVAEQPVAAIEGPESMLGDNKYGDEIKIHLGGMD